MILWDIVWWILTILLGVAATVQMALSMILRNGGRTAIERRLAASGRDAKWRALDERRLLIAHAAAGMGIITAVLWLVLWTIDFSGIPGPEFSLPGFIIGLVTGMILSWIALDLVATAASRHAAPATVSHFFWVIRLLTIATYLISGLVAFTDEVNKRLSGANLEASDEQAEAEAELLRSIEQTHREGGLDEGAVALLENVVEFSSTDVGEVMTPRTDIDGLEYTDDLTEIRRFIGEVGHSRIPVFEEDLDHIVGILYAKDLVRWLGEIDPNFTLRPLLRRPIVVPETKQVADRTAGNGSAETKATQIEKRFGIEELRIFKLRGAEAVSLSAFRRAHSVIYVPL